MKNHLLEIAKVVGFMMVVFSVLNATIALEANDLDDTSSRLLCLSNCDSGCTLRTPTYGVVAGVSFWICQPIGTGCNRGFICDCYCDTNAKVINPPTVCYCN